MLKRGRIDYIDIARGIGILAIIAGHIPHAGTDWPYPLVRVCFTFHVSLFFIVGGILVHKYDWKTLLKKRFKSLIIPYLVTSLIIMTIVFLIRHTPLEIPGNADRNVASWFMSMLYGSGSLVVGNFYPIGAIWFLLAMFFSSIYLNLIIDKKGRWFYAIIPMIIAYMMAPDIWAPLSIMSATAGTFLMLIGVKLKEIGLEKVLKWPVVLISFVIWLAIFCMDYNSVKLFSIVELSFSNLPLNFIAAVTGTIVVLGIAKIADKYLRKIIHPLKVFGEYSLIVLCAHLIEMDFVPWYKILGLFGLKDEWYFHLICEIIWCTCWVLIVRFLMYRKVYKRELAVKALAYEKAEA